MTYLSVLFASGRTEDWLGRSSPEKNTRMNRYAVSSVRAVAGASPDLLPGAVMLRVEGDPSDPLLADENINGKISFLLRGATRHLQYTGAGQRTELNARSRAELDPSPGTAAVLIPIKKSEAWWALAQDERQAHFQRTGSAEGHTAIGLRYADKIFRRLYHCRGGGLDKDGTSAPAGGGGTSVATSSTVPRLTPARCNC